MNDINRFSELLSEEADPSEIPPLENGDHLTRDEFERRYEMMPNVKKAELIEGVVFMPSPVRHRHHSRPHADLMTWVGTYMSATAGTDHGNTGTVRLDLGNEPQPDCVLFIASESGGNVVISDDDYVVGSPDLAVEVASNTVSIDMCAKKDAYLRNGVREYIVFRVADAELDWFVNLDGRFERLSPDADGVLRSDTFHGLWLDVPALLRRDLATVLSTLQRGLASPEHANFVTLLRERRIE